jgi:DUF4097 and DUF4098 domain-containing protein YvlB
MKLDIYLEELKRELEKRNIAEKDDILQYFEEMITDREESGEEIDSILSSLGEPCDVINSLYGAEEKEESAETEKEDTSKRYSFADVRSIKIENVTYDFCFHEDDVDEVTVVFNDDKYTTLNVECDNGRLKIEQEYAFKGITALFSSLTRLFSDSDKNNMAGRYRAEVFLPRNARLDLKMETVSGETRFTDIGIGDLKMETVSGDLELNGCNFDDCSVDSVSGNIEVHDLIVDEKFDVESVSGDLEIDGIRCEKIEIDTVSGDAEILIDGPKDDYNVKISKVLKDISTEGKRHSYLKVNTVSGTITYNFTK